MPWTAAQDVVNFGGQFTDFKFPMQLRTVTPSPLTGRLLPFMPPELGREELRIALENPDPYAELASRSRQFAFLWDETSFNRIHRSLRVVPPYRGDFRDVIIPTGERDPVFPEMLLSIVYFVHRLYIRLIQDGVRDAFFLSREGYLLKRIFEDYQQFLGLSRVRTHYLMVSRRSTYAPSLSSAESDDFERCFAQYSYTSIEELLRTLNIAPDRIERLRAALDLSARHSFGQPIDFSRRIPHITASTELARLKRSPLFRSSLKETIEGQRKAFLQYLHSFDVPLESLALVDVGWKGSIQNNIFLMFDRKIPVTGYYLGITEESVYHPLLKRVPVLFSVPARSLYRQAYNEHRPLFEIVLGAPHGSVERYDEESGNPITTWQDREQQLYDTVISPFQNRMLAAAPGIIRSIMGCSDSPEQLFRRVAMLHSRMVFRPSKREIDFFQSLTHFENFGVFEFANYVKRTPRFSREWFQNLKSLRRNFFLMLSRDIWPALTLTNMNARFLQPFYGWARHFATFYPLHRKLRYLRKIDPREAMVPITNHISEIDHALAAQEQMLAERKTYRDLLIERLGSS